jgi:hypothetical protein
MGAGRWDSREWAATRSAYTTSAKPTVDHIYTSREIDDVLDPKRITLRESRDSAVNPNSTALIVALDVTGSMDRVLDVMARDGLGTLVGQMYERRPITDPHVMIMGIGDFECDSAPLQVTQFEAENAALVGQMEKIYLERGGGGNCYESYAATWLFAATRTAIDCYEKRGKRGYLFTVGDEEPTPRLYADNIRRVMGGEVPGDFDGGDLLRMVQATYHVCHVLVEEGNYAKHNLRKVRSAWTDLIGQNLIPLADHRKLAEVVVSAMQVIEGHDRNEVIKSWKGDASLVVAQSLRDLAVIDRTDTGTMRLY